jgi:predicted nucleic acid-binding protein
LKIYLDTSVLISLADSFDAFHDQTLNFIRRLIKNNVDYYVSAPLVVELGKIVETKETERCLRIMDTIEKFGIHFIDIAMKEVWSLSQNYLDANILKVRHRLDLFHYAAASLLNCTHLASWNKRQFNDKIAERINRVNVNQGLLSLIVGSPDYIVRREKLA